MDAAIAARKLIIEHQSDILQCHMENYGRPTVAIYSSCRNKHSDPSEYMQDIIIHVNQISITGRKQWESYQTRETNSIKLVWLTVHRHSAPHHDRT